MTKNKLNIKIWRDIKQMKFRGLAIVFAVSFGVAYYGGYYMAVESLKYSYMKISHDLNLAHLQVFIDPSTEEELPKLDDITGIRMYKKRLFAPGSVELKSKGSLPVYMIYDDLNDKAPINNLKILEGENLTKEDDDENILRVLIDRTMASVHSFKTGDQLTLTLHGTEREMEIKGVDLSPEFLYPSSNPSLLLAAKGSLGIIFSNMDEVKRFFGYPLYNNLSFTFEPGSDARKLEEIIHQRLSKIRIEAFIPQRESLDQKIMNWGHQVANKFGPIASIIIIPVVFIIIYINMYRMMEERRRETGILIAMGCRKRAVISYFFRMNLLYVVIGSILGFGASLFLNPIFAVNFAKQLSFPELHCIYPPWFPIKGIIYGIIIFLVAFIISSLRVLSLMPNEAIRGETLGARHSLPNWISYLEKPNKRLGQSLFSKYAIRGILRRPNLAAVTILSVSFALALAVSFNIIITSTNWTLKYFFDHDPWNLIVDFKTTLDSGEIRKELPQGLVDIYEGYIKGMGVIEVNGTKSFGQIIGLEAGSRMRKLEFIQGRGFSDNNALEVILNRNLWKERALKLGEKIPIETAKGQYKMNLVGIVDEVNIAIEYAYLPIGTAQKVLDQDGKYTGIWAVSKYEPEEVKRVLYRNKMISRVTPKKDIDNIIDQTLASFKVGVSGVLAMSMLMAPIFLFTSMGLSILEKERDFVILRSMGFKRKDIIKILMIEALTIGVIGAIFSLGLAILMGMVQNHFASDIYCNINTYVRPSDYTYILLCLPLFPLVALIFAHRIMRLNIVDRLAMYF